MLRMSTTDNTGMAPCALSDDFAQRVVGIVHDAGPTTGLRGQSAQAREKRTARRRAAWFKLGLLADDYCHRCPIFDICAEQALSDPWFDGVAAGQLYLGGKRQDLLGVRHVA